MEYNRLQLRTDVTIGDPSETGRFSRCTKVNFQKKACFLGWGAMFEVSFQKKASFLGCEG